ncbi:pyridoxal-dependent decarboxylase [Chryseobacterium indologenes]|uniref:pyridoxal-dependent decarboxylase n=1 Tax=Chryseobacterium indologenes TaxID=253 RepID=UPI001626C20A|nr:pyridoxal-dependent decarboxylase [Chryseobacterium indologenes]
MNSIINANNTIVDEPFEKFLKQLKKVHYGIQARAKNHQTLLTKKAQKELGPKYPIEVFNYETELSNLDEHILSEEDLIEEMYSFLQGSTRPQSHLSLFNMVPEPMVDAVVSSCISTIYNVNSLMDMYGGKSLLIEQKVARTIGQWINWNESYGIACNGGKITMLYAIKSAISRIAPESQREGIPNNLVVMVNEGGHYCVEHICSLLGIGAINCLRVPINAEGKMNMTALEQLLAIQVEKGNRIAAIICCGGTTINFCCDETLLVSQLVDRFVDDHQLDYRPYLHLDSVIGWIYFTLLRESETEIRNLGIPASILNKFLEVRKRFLGLASFDSFGVDFHKDGLCPYSSSFFISRNSNCFNMLTQGNYTYGSQDLEFEQFRAYRYTLENSRPSQGILASWIMLKKLGRNGLLQYLVKLHKAQSRLIKKMEHRNLFKVLNSSSLGWEIVFSIDFTMLLSAERENFDAHQVAMAFMQRCWDKVNKGEVFPFFSIVPDYKTDHNSDHKTTAFLLYPMQTDLSSASIDKILNDITNEVIAFQKEIIVNSKSLTTRILEKPIR